VQSLALYAAGSKKINVANGPNGEVFENLANYEPLYSTDGTKSSAYTKRDTLIKVVADMQTRFNSGIKVIVEQMKAAGTDSKAIDRFIKKERKKYFKARGKVNKQIYPGLYAKKKKARQKAAAAEANAKVQSNADLFAKVQAGQAEEQAKHDRLAKEYQEWEARQAEIERAGNPSTAQVNPSDVEFLSNASAAPGVANTESEADLAKDTASQEDADKTVRDLYFRDVSRDPS